MLLIGTACGETGRLSFLHDSRVMGARETLFSPLFPGYGSMGALISPLFPGYESLGSSYSPLFPGYESLGGYYSHYSRVMKTWEAIIPVNPGYESLGGY